MEQLFPPRDGPTIVGVVHLLPLPGAPRYDGDREGVRTRAVEEATVLSTAGVDAIVIENFGDAPYYPEEVPKAVVAEMTAIASDVEDAVNVPFGVNVLRNDADAAVAIAAATGGSFVRVNVHVGTAATDQGVLDGRAHETIRQCVRIDADVAILADVHVKHATPIGDASIERTAVETIGRGLADGVIVSGAGTGRETPLDPVKRVVGVVDESTPVFVGSGVTADTVADYLEAGADGIVVGTALKRDGETTARVERERVEAFADVARHEGSTSETRKS